MTDLFDSSSSNSSRNLSPVVPRSNDIINRSRNSSQNSSRNSSQNSSREVSPHPMQNHQAQQQTTSQRNNPRFPSPIVTNRYTQTSNQNQQQQTYQQQQQTYFQQQQPYQQQQQTYYQQQPYQQQQPYYQPNNYAYHHQTIQQQQFHPSHNRIKFNNISTNDTRSMNMNGASASLSESNRDALNLAKSVNDNDTAVSFAGYRNQERIARFVNEDNHDEREFQKDIRKIDMFAQNKDAELREKAQEFEQKQKELNRKVVPDTDELTTEQVQLLNYFGDLCKSKGIKLKNRSMTDCGHTEEFKENINKNNYKKSVIFYGVEGVYQHDDNKAFIIGYSDENKDDDTVYLGNGWSYDMYRCPLANDVVLVHYIFNETVRNRGKVVVKKTKKSCCCLPGCLIF